MANVEINHRQEELVCKKKNKFQHFMLHENATYKSAHILCGS